MHFRVDPLVTSNKMHPFPLSFFLSFLFFPSVLFLELLPVSHPSLLGFHIPDIA